MKRHAGRPASTPREMRMFLLGGVLNTAGSYLLYLALAEYIDYQLAYGIAFLAGIVFAYWFNAALVFRVGLRWKGLFAYPLVYACQYGLSAVLLGFLIERLDVPLRLAPLLVAAITFPATFVLSRWLLRADPGGGTAGKAKQ